MPRARGCLPSSTTFIISGPGQVVEWLKAPASKAGESLISTHISLLHRVLGILIITQKPAGKIIGGIEMREEDLFKVGLTRITSRIAMLIHSEHTGVQPVLFPKNSLFCPWNK